MAKINREMLKEVVKEALVEILPEILMMMNEQIRESRPSSIVEQDEPDLDLIRSKFRAAQDNNIQEAPYSDSLSPRQSYGSSGGLPKNKKAIINGEPFASGQGIMDWYTGSKGKEIQQNIQERETKMEEYMKKRFGS